MEGMWNINPQLCGVMARRRDIKFTDKRHTTKGIASTVLGVLSIVVMIALVVISYFSRGNAGIYAGSIGLSAFLMSVVGMFTGFSSFQERERYYLFSKIGTLLNVLIIIVWIAVYILGMGYAL